MELEGLDEEILFGDVDSSIAPPSLRATGPVMDLAFHPSLPLLAAGLVSGEVELFQYSGQEMIKKPLENDFASWVFRRGSGYKSAEVATYHNHGNMQMHPYGGITGMEFTDDGSYLVTASSDKTISVLDCVSSRLVIHISCDEVSAQTSSKKKINRNNKKNDDNSVLQSKKQLLQEKKKKKTFRMTTNPHKHGISSLNVCDENLIATGDDDGLVAIWDMRQRCPAFTYHEHGDYVSQLLYFSDACELVSSSGDTCLGVFDTKAGKVRDFSEKRKDELTCFAFINSSGASSTFIPSILCGTSTGALPIWKYGSWRRPYDTMEGHPRECEAIISFNNEETTFNHNIVLTGACDGIVRVMQMYPLRRQLCHLSARDVIQGSTFSNSTGTLHKQENLVVRRERGGEAIRRMRVSHDSALLAVSGMDAVVDFVDIRFLSDEKALDALRYKREQRHIATIREMEAERDAKAAAEERLLAGGGDSSSDSDSEDDDSDADDSDTDDSDDDEDASQVASGKRKRLRAEALTSNKTRNKSGSAAVRGTDTDDANKEKKKRKKNKAKGPEAEEAKDWMAEYQLDRAKKRERVAAAKWLKEEKKKKVNFTYEKRRRRVGGFFSDLQD
eukprot:gene11010-7653_t